MSLNEIKKLFYKKYTSQKKETVRIKHFFYTVAHQLEGEGKKFSSAIFYLFYLYQKVLKCVNENDFISAEKTLLKADGVKSKLKECETEIGNILYYSCISYLHYKTQNNEMAKQNILKAIESVDAFFCEDPLLEMMLKSEYLLNYFRVLLQNSEIEEAKKVCFALLNLVFYQENTREIVFIKNIKRLKGNILEIETMKYNFVNYIFRRIILLPESIQDDFISYLSNQSIVESEKKEIFSLLKILNLSIENHNNIFLKEIIEFIDEDFIINTPDPVLNLVFNKINSCCKSEYNVNFLKEIENFKKRNFIF